MEKIYHFDSSSLEKIDHIDHLWKQLNEDMKQCQLDLVSITTTNDFNRELSLSSIFTPQEASFLFGQAVREVIYRLKFETGSKDVFLDFCRINYKHHDEQLKQIEEFANNYRPNQALSWLIQSSFISMILQRAQRTFEIDIIYKLGFFLKQLNIQLTRLAEENHSSLEEFFTVYRGKTLPKCDFDQLMKNTDTSLVSFNAFLIATRQKDMAMDFIHRRLIVHPDRIGILFEIALDRRLCNGKYPFALLKDMNNDQICFDVNTIFRLIEIDRITDSSSSIWIVRLILPRDDEVQLSPFRVLLRSDELHANPLPFLAKLLMDMGEYRRAEQCFLAFLQDPSILSQPRRLTRVQNGLGGISMHRGDYGKALEYYQKALATTLIYLPPDHIDLIPIYKSIGDAYWNDCSYVSAMENYEKAIALAEKNSTQNYSELLADIHLRVDKTQQAMSQ